MLNAETKRHIDAARDVLVGVAPNPMTQIDQITYALIYKFMDDMDQAAIKAGGEPSFFVGELEPYSWSKLVDARMGNQEKMNLYGEALQKFSEAKQLPELFRTIFRAAFLPYRSPETLGLFLKEINYFDYTHPEELGNAYEYLLSIMSAQGDAGQFRTPRHIIDFMVDVMNPTKDDKVLDPACGTGGFLVASYNHILEQHDGKDDPSKKEKPLTPDERKKLMANFEGYDIDPSMVRIAQVNMYLHQFKNPKIFQYDSLTSEERWNDKFDVILANPPFMSPKGGIKPHNKFAIQSNRSEVLFVDYIANHLKPNGRAAIIVPEGIIFQSGKAYKQLRKELVEGGLYAVVSLPSGVFNPYSGVKTSILLINNEIAKQKDEILFVKITNDGYDLGATKRPIEKNDLPEALDILQSFIFDGNVESRISITQNKKFILESPDCVLSMDRYTSQASTLTSDWPLVKLKDISEVFLDGDWIESKDQSSDGIRLVQTGNIGNGNFLDKSEKARYISEETFSRLNCTEIRENDLLISRLPDPVGRACLLPGSTRKMITSVDVTIIRPKPEMHPKFLMYMCQSTEYFRQVESFHTGSSRVRISRSNLGEVQVPLPPLEVQEQLVAELDGYAAIIEGAKKIVENWKPRIDVDPEWSFISLGQVADVISGQSPEGSSYNENGIGMPFHQGKTEFSRKYLGSAKKWTTSVTKLAAQNDILMSVRAPVGPVNLATEEICIGRGLAAIRPKKVHHGFLFYWLRSIQETIKGNGGAVFDSISRDQICDIQIPNIPMDLQENIGSQMEAEEKIIELNEDLATRLLNRIAVRVSSLWSI